ncbi:lipoprotein [Vibrio phage K389]|nr:PHB domain-containing protein [Vibrio phage 268E42.1]
MEIKQVKKMALGGVAVAAAAIIGLNSYTVVSAGTAKVQTTFGTVNQVHYGEGLHFPVNPLSSFDEFDTRNSKYEINGLNIPTQDRFNSTGNVTVLYRIQDSKTPFIKQNYGNASEYVDKTLRQYLRSIVRDEGRKIQDSRGLADSSNVTVLQDNAKNRLIEEMDGTGIDVQEVLVQDIAFDPRIAQQILDTQKRIQVEEQKLSEERQAVTDAAIKKQQAIGEANKKREAADAEAYRAKVEAEGRKSASIATAEGKAEAILLQAKAEAESIKLIADANLKLTKSLTPAILEKQRLDNEAILYGKSKGNVPTTVIGDTDLRAIGVPMATVK